MSFINTVKRKTVDGDRVIVETKTKTFASLGWKSNTLAQTFSSAGEWKSIPSNVPLTFQVVSPDTATILGDSTGYSIRYDGDYSIYARCAIHVGVDLSAGTVLKTIAFRMVYNGTPLSPFLELHSNFEGEHGGSEILLQLNKNDVLEFEFTNMTDTNEVTVKYMQIVATEI